MPRLRDLPIGWRLNIPALGALVGLVLVAITMFASVASVREADNWDVHTREVLLHSRAQEGAFLAMVSALDRYVIGGDPSFHEDYRAAVQRMEEEHGLLRSLVANNPPQIVRQERRRALIGAWQADVAEPVLRAAPAERMAAFRLDRARELTDALGTERQTFNAVEEGLLAQRRAAADRSLQVAVAAVALALLGELVLVVLSTILAARSIMGPLAQLAATTQRIGRGELEARANLASRDELGVLGRAFDAMAEQVATRKRERDQAEQALQRSADEARRMAAVAERERQQKVALLDSTGEGTYGLDLEGCCTFLNRAGAALLGYTPDEVLGKDMHALIHSRRPDGSPYPADECPLFRAFRTGQSTQVDNETLWRRDGTAFTAECTSAPIRDRERLAGAVVTFRDVTERQRVEEQLRLQDRAIGATSNGLVITDPNQPDNPIVFANPAFERLTGYRTGEAVGRNCRFLQGPDTDRAVVQTIREALAEQRECRGTLLNYRKDGSPFWNELFVSPVRDDQGCLTHFVGVQTDVTERKQAEAEHARLTATVERERATLTSIMSGMSDGIGMFDATGRLRYRNERARELLGIEGDPMTDQPAEAILARIRPRLADPEAVWAAWQHAVAHVHELPSLELALTAPRPSDVRLQLFPLADGTPTGWGIGVLLHDVTAERDLSRTKDELVSVVSHELRTPLASIVGFAELLLDREYPDAKRRQFLTIMREEGQRLTALINDFLDLQRMESGQQVITLQTTALQPLVERAVASVGEDAAHPMDLNLPDDLPPVCVDPERIQQVLANLLSNARKYSPAGGAVHLTARRVPGAVEISLQDEGLGLPPEAVPRLFEKFYRVDNTDRRTIKGTGLGLAICRQIVEAHGGRIWAESAGLGQGSRFCFTVPLAEVAATQGEVLVVEDDVGFARLLEAELAERGYRTARVTSAEAALDWWQAAPIPPRAVLLDLVLPQMHGEMFLRRLRAATGTEIPIVVVTMKDLDDAERHRLSELGVVTVLRKGPGVAAQAADAIAQLLNERKGVRP